MKGKKLLIALVLAILILTPISSQCDPPERPNDRSLLDEDAILGVETSDPAESSTYTEFNPKSLHVVALLLVGGFVGLLAIRRRFKN